MAIVLFLAMIQDARHSSYPLIIKPRPKIMLEFLKNVTFLIKEL